MRNTLGIKCIKTVMMLVCIYGLYHYINTILLIEQGQITSKKEITSNLYPALIMVGCYFLRFIPLKINNKKSLDKDI
jgi:hypothetical protein